MMPKLTTIVTATVLGVANAQSSYGGSYGSIAPSPTLSGDPHLVGFHGQKFDVIGTPGFSYSLLEDDRIQAMFKIDTPHFEHSSDKALRESGQHKGLFATAVDVMFLNGDGEVQELNVYGDFNSTVHGSELWCDVKRTNCLRGLTAQVNGNGPITTATSLELGKDSKFNIGNVDCPFEKRNTKCGAFHKANGGYAVATLKTPSLQVDVGVQFMNNHELGHRTLHHLDLDVSMYRPSGKSGGLLGQTVDIQYDAKGLPIMKGPAVIGGDENAFIVDGVDPSKLQDSPYDHLSPLFSAKMDGDTAV